MGTGFRLLGGVEVRVDGRLVDVGHARQRCVLVVLLIDANRVVSVDGLVARVWGDRAPARARETLYNYVSRLRHALGSVEVELTRRAGGYVLTCDPLAVDVHRFRHLVGQARATDDADQAVASFREALALWRGEPCAGVDTPWVNTLRDGLERDRFAAELDYTELQLRRGLHSQMVGELIARAATYPLDERVAGQVMLALYQCGRQAEALEHFQRLRARLADELGIDPGPDLRRLFEQILTTDPALTTVPPAPVGPQPAVAEPVSLPRQLPAHTPHFVGRGAELDQLAALLSTTRGAGTVVITAIDGTAGIGKTALALHWAHHAAQRFPDGQLYVNLRGFDPTGTPVNPAAALRGFLDALQIPPERIPTSEQAQAGLYRSLLAERRMLIVLDNARDTDQVRPLLPASPTSLVLITSRNQLTGLVAQEGAHPLTLDLLTEPEARALLFRRLGTDLINAEPHAVTDLIHHCARLPLALAIVAARANTHPGLELRVLAKELADEHTRLDALDTGEPTTSARTVFSWSYQYLSQAAARVFRLLGLHPGPDIALPAASRLADLPTHQTREALGELTRAHLLTQHTTGRYTFHDLLRTYATHLTTVQDSEEDQHAALARLFDHYLHATTAAMNTLHPGDLPPPGIPPPAGPTPPLTDPATARAWLDTERTNLTAVVARAAAHGWHTHATRLADTLAGYLEVGGHHSAALAIHSRALQAARHLGDGVTQVRCLTGLGVAHWRLGNYQQAVDHHEQALAVAREIGYTAGEALALSSLGVVHWQQGSYQQAVDHHEQALAVAREIGYTAGEALALTDLGLLYWRQGRYQQAADHHRQAIAVSRQIGYSAGEILAFGNLGRVCQQQGCYEEAINHHKHALALSHQAGDRFGEAAALNNLGTVYQLQGQYQQATEHHQRAVCLFREIGYRSGETHALTNLGRVYQRQGRYEQAGHYHHEALARCREIGDPLNEIQALTNLGLVYQRQGRHQQAVDHHQRGLVICREIGDRASEAQVLNGLGEANRAAGNLDDARALHTAALSLATELGDRYEQARAHHGLARTHHTAGDHDQARHHGQHALTLYTDLDVPDTDDVHPYLPAPREV